MIINWRDCLITSSLVLLCRRVDIYEVGSDEYRGVRWLLDVVARFTQLTINRHLSCGKTASSRLVLHLLLLVVRRSWAGHLERRRPQVLRILASGHLSEVLRLHILHLVRDVVVHLLLLLPTMFVIGHADSWIAKLKINWSSWIVPGFTTLARKHATSLACLSSLLESLFQVDNIGVLWLLAANSNAFGSTTMLSDSLRGPDRRESWLECFADIALAIA